MIIIIIMYAIVPVVPPILPGIRFVAKREEVDRRAHARMRVHKRTEITLRLTMIVSCQHIICHILSLSLSTYIYIYIYIYIYTHYIYIYTHYICIYIYIYVFVILV